MRALAPWGGFPREAADIASSWHHPLRMDNGRLQALIGPEPRTALDEAVRQTLVHLGCVAEREHLSPVLSP